MLDTRPIVHRRWYAWLVALGGAATLAVVVLGSRLADGPASGRSPVHQWLGLVVAGAMSTHFVLHGRWLLRVVRLFRESTARADRLNFIIVCTLAGLLVVVTASGFVIGGLAGGNLDRTQPFVGVHHVVTKALLLLAVWHVVRHRRWLWAKLRGPHAAREDR